MRRSVIIIVMLLSVLALPLTAFGGASDPVDSYVSAFTGPPDQRGLNFGAGATLSTASSFVSACNPSNIVYLRWSLAGTTGAADAAFSSLALDATFATGTAGAKLEFYKVADDSWTEGGITWNNAPALGDSLGNINAPAAAGPVTFANAALAGYINEESAFAGDGTAGNDLITIAIKITGCSTNNAVVLFTAKDAASGTPPALIIKNANAVTLSGFSGGPSTNLPLVAGLGLGAVAFLAAGLFIYRRRAATRA